VDKERGQEGNQEAEEASRQLNFHVNEPVQSYLGLPWRNTTAQATASWPVGLHGRKEPGAPTMNTTGGLLYYSYDGLGNLSALTDRLGQVAARYRYDAFGGLLTSATAPYNLMGAFGKEFDPASGLVYFGARWYDAQTGRFTLRKRDVLSRYGY